MGLSRQIGQSSEAEYLVEKPNGDWGSSKYTDRNLKATQSIYFIW